MRLTSSKTSNFLRLNAFCSKNDVKGAKTRYFALKTRYLHIIGFNAMKAFLSKNDVKCAKTRHSALKTSFMHIIGFNAMEALGNVETH